MTEKRIIETPDVFRLVAGGVWDLDRFMEWYLKERDKAYSKGYSEASEVAYHNGSGGEF